MKRILVPSSGAESWRSLLASPLKHWRLGYSARALAHAWEASAGFPPEVRRAFAKSQFRELRTPTFLLGIPEYPTSLPGGSRPSYTDLFVLARAKQGLLTIAVEGKVKESFGPLVSEWRRGASAGKLKRWAAIEQVLRLRRVSADRLRYQLFHRAAAAVLEAERFGTEDAVLLVHSFSAANMWYDDFVAFVEFMGANATKGSLIHLTDLGSVRLHAAWVRGAPRFLKA